jgi:riboflavin kinase / FMN adenylyltransferase
VRGSPGADGVHVPLNRARVIVIGNFDGVHEGHKAVLRQARRASGEHGQGPVVFTFHPHPNEVLGRGLPPKLTTLARRKELLIENGASSVIVEPFTLDLASWSPERFARELLHDRLRAEVVVVGENFRFGHKRAGDIETLRALGETLGFETRPAEIVGDVKGPFSSTRIRDAIAKADLDEATAVLGRPHALSGVVVRGDRIGRTLGFPTANLGGIEEMLPPHGVYAVRARTPAALCDAVMNIGTRPTVDGRVLRVEVHLLDVDVDLYDANLRVDLVARVRGEEKFDGRGALKAQIGRDVEAARALLGSAPAVPSAGG